MPSLSVLLIFACLLTVGTCQEYRLAVNIGDQSGIQRASSRTSVPSSYPPPSPLTAPPAVSTNAAAPAQAVPSSRQPAYKVLLEGQNVVGTVQKVHFSPICFLLSVRCFLWRLTFAPRLLTSKARIFQGKNDLLPALTILVTQTVCHVSKQFGHGLG